MICIIACGSNKVTDIKSNLTQIGVESEIISMEDTTDTDLDIYSGIIISGSPILVTEDGMDEHLEKFKFLQDYNRPVLGICFGHQVLSLLHGAAGSIGDAVKRDESIEIVEPSTLFSGIDDKTHFSQNHCEYMSVPNDFILLAKSDSCQNEAMSHKARPLFGVQFHPEVSGVAGQTLLRNFVKLCE